MKSFMLLLLILISFSLHAQYDFAEWKDEKYNAANTGSNASYLSSDEKEIIRLMNLARINGKLFAETYVKKYAELKGLQEHPRVKSLISDLAKSKSLVPLKPSEGLTKCARAHAVYMGKSGNIGHKGKGGKGPSDRIEQYIEWDVWIAENCQYGAKTPVDIVLHLLIDEKVSDLGHRKNILEIRGRYVGVAIEPHKGYKINCVMDFAGGIIKE